MAGASPEWTKSPTTDCTTYLANWVRAIVENSGGTLWLGRAEGLKELRDGRVIRTFGTQQGLASNKILALHRDRTAICGSAAASRLGLTRFHDGQVKIFTEEDGLIDGRIRSIIEDHEGICGWPQPAA